MLQTGGTQADVVCIVLQELVALDAGSILLNSGGLAAKFGAGAGQKKKGLGGFIKSMTGAPDPADFEPEPDPNLIEAWCANP